MMKKLLTIVFMVMIASTMALADGSHPTLREFLANPSLAESGTLMRPSTNVWQEGDGCEFTCPDSATEEDEAFCETGMNDGCFADDGSVEDTYLPCPSLICGTAPYVDGEIQDADFYRFTLTQYTEFSIGFFSDFPVGVALVAINGGCESSQLITLGFSPGCVAVFGSFCLPAGDYWFILAPLGPSVTGGCGHYIFETQCGECDCDGTQAAYLDPVPPVCDCVYLCAGSVVPLYICGSPGPDQPPVVEVNAGCYNPDRIPSGCYDESCPPAEFDYDPFAWYYDPTTGCWVNYVIGWSDGCVCVCLDRYLPVELRAFDAIAGNGRITLHWETASETNSDRFELVRGESVLARIPAQNGAAGHAYNYVDADVQTGMTYTYTLYSVDLNGARQELATASAAAYDGAATITEYELHQNYPNPFNPTTQISFDLKEAGMVTLKVYDLTGREVVTLLNSTMSEGTHNVTFSASGLPSGVYMYTLKAGSFTATKKMLLMK